MLDLKTLIHKPVLRLWFDQVQLELKGYLNIQNFSDFNSLKSSFNNVYYNGNEDCIILLDTENNFSSEYLIQLKILNPKLKLIGIGLPKDIDETIYLLRNGFNSYLEIGCSSVDIYSAIINIRSGGIYLSNYKVEEILNNLVNRANLELSESQKSSKYKSPNVTSSFNLTEKQKIVCEYLIKGYSYKEIAGFLGISTFTVNQRTKTIYKKLNVKSRGELSYLYIK